MKWHFISTYSSIESESLCDGHSYSPQSMHSWLTRVMYNRRTRINPFWNTVIIGGYHDNKPYVLIGKGRELIMFSF